MPKIAVDAALLPSEEVTAGAIEANRKLSNQYPHKIILTREDCLPHISLAMGCISSRGIAQIGAVLRELAEKHLLGTLISTGIQVGTNAAGEKVSVLALERTDELQALHEDVMHGLAPWFGSDVKPEMLLSPPAVEQSTLNWIRDYRAKSSFERFFPHITLGYGNMEDFAFPHEFTASRLVLCHLGNHCTCRRILTTAELPM